MQQPLPVHPRTGLTALGIGKRGPIWPVAGGSEDHDAGGPGGESGGKADDSSKTGGDAGGADKGYPANTPVAEMTPEQQVAYWRDKARKHEDANKKRADYDDLKKAAEELEQIKQARKSEAERLKERAEKAEKEAAAARAEVLRSKVASRKGIPADMADVLKGSTEEEMEAHADTILPYIKTTGGSGSGNGNGTTRRVADVDQGAGGGQPPKATEASGRALYAERHKNTPPTFS